MINTDEAWQCLCLDTTKYVDAAGACQACDGACSTCTGGTAADCLVCAAGKYGIGSR